MALSKSLKHSDYEVLKVKLGERHRSLTTVSSSQVVSVAPLLFTLLRARD